MSIMDSTLEFCDATDVSASTGTAIAGDVIDLGAQARDPGAGYPLYLVIAVTTAFTSGTSSTIQFELASDDSASIATGGGATTHYKSEIFADTDLVEGYTIVIQLPSSAPEYERYLGLLAITGAAATTAGSINAYLTLDPPNWKSYADADN